MDKLQRLQLRSVEIRERLTELADPDADLTDESRAELRALRTELSDVEAKRAAAMLAAETREETTETAPDAELRERIELRSKARLTAYLTGFARGALPSGAEAELASACEVEPGMIPLDLWEPTPDAEERDVTPAPSTVGVNLQPIRPAVFAPSILPRLGVDMPSVPSGTYAEGRISTSQTAAAKAKGDAIAATAGAITVSTTTPHRVAARLEVALEDVAAIGQANFESMLRQNTSLALSDELDDQGLNGSGQDANLSGIFTALTDPSAPAAEVASFDKFLETVVAGIEGLWATRMTDLHVVINPETFRLAQRTFRDIASADNGDISFGDYAAAKIGGWWTNKRMPDKASHVAQAILYRSGRMLEGGSQSMRTAVCPVWARGIGIDDIYSGSAKGERYFTLSALLGDVIVVQPDAYAQIAFRVSA